jgi:hypothetical protein
MAIDIKTLTEPVPDFSEYPWWVKPLVLIWLAATFACISTYLFVHKIEPVDKWLNAP